jgi:hypothetical protein
MPFTLAHPAAVLPLLRRPFVPAALVAGAMAPDVPYFLTAGGLTRTSASWYEPLLNATHTHSLAGLPIDLLYAVGLVAAYWLVRAPITALLPSGLGLPEPERPTSAQDTGRYVGWLLLSALIGVATHLFWDALTDAGFLPAHLRQASAVAGLTTPRLLQYASTTLGLAVTSWFLWKHRGHLRTDEGSIRHLGTVTRRVVTTSLIAVPLLGGAALARDDYASYSTVTRADYSRPVVVDEGNGETSTTYPETTVPAFWGTVAGGVLTGAAKRAGITFAAALLLYAAAWQIGCSPHLSVARRARPESGTPGGEMPAARHL